ncbi:MAG: RNA-binding cell elongation regulator Jag/EloR [Eubacteriales bacterium]
MRKETTVTAKTVDEALVLAATELGAEVSDLEYTVLEEAKKGLFGIGATPAKVKVSYAPTGIDLALDFVKTTLNNMNIDAVLTVSDTELGKKIDISGEAAGVLIGHHGETLDSFQHLANLAANRTENKKNPAPKISVDIESYRAKREEALRALARRMAHRVVKYKKSVMLEPMNPYERRIIHAELQSFPGVNTNSIGSESNRKVVIYLDETKA